MGYKEIKVSNKHVKLRIALTISFFVLAVGSITFGIIAYAHKDPGYYSFEADNNPDHPLYRTGIKGCFYFSGSSSSIKNNINNAKGIMSDSLLKSYLLFDEENGSNDVRSIAHLNSHPNIPVLLNHELYEVLEDALIKTNANKNYSLYSAPLYSYWERLTSFSDSARDENDPKNSEVYNLELQNLLKYCSSTYINLELKGEDTAVLHVDEEYLEYRKEDGLGAPLISLNVLKEAYRLKILLKDFANSGYRNGYFVTDSGLLVSLKEHADPVYSIYDNKKGDILKSSKVSFISPSCASSLYRFDFSNYQTNYVLKDGTVRNLLLNINSGFGDDKYRASTLFAKDNDIVEVAYLNNYLSTVNPAEIKTLLEAEYSDYLFAYSVNEEGLNIYATNNLRDFISVDKSLGYNLSII